MQDPAAATRAVQRRVPLIPVVADDVDGLRAERRRQIVVHVVGGVQLGETAEMAPQAPKLKEYPFHGVDLLESAGKPSSGCSSPLPTALTSMGQGSPSGSGNSSRLDKLNSM